MESTHVVIQVKNKNHERYAFSPSLTEMKTHQYSWLAMNTDSVSIFWCFCRIAWYTLYIVGLGPNFCLAYHELELSLERLWFKTLPLLLVSMNILLIPFIFCLALFMDSCISTCKTGLQVRKVLNNLIYTITPLS